MRERRHAGATAFTLAELMIAITAAAVLMLAGFALWTFSYRQMAVARARSTASQTAFAVLQRIEQEVMRAETVDVPDPDHANSDSIQLQVPVDGGSVRRSFRLSDDELIIDLKDEGDVIVAFDDIASLGFEVLDAPQNTQVRISCRVEVRGEGVDMQTVARKRN